MNAHAKKVAKMAAGKAFNDKSVKQDVLPNRQSYTYDLAHGRDHFELTNKGLRSISMIGEAGIYDIALGAIVFLARAGSVSLDVSRQITSVTVGVSPAPQNPHARKAHTVSMLEIAQHAKTRKALIEYGEITADDRRQLATLFPNHFTPRVVVAAPAPAPAPAIGMSLMGK